MYKSYWAGKVVFCPVYIPHFKMIHVVHNSNVNFFVFSSVGCWWYSKNNYVSMWLLQFLSSYNNQWSFHSNLWMKGINERKIYYVFIRILSSNSKLNDINANNVFVNRTNTRVSKTIHMCYCHLLVRVLWPHLEINTIQFMNEIFFKIILIAIKHTLFYSFYCYEIKTKLTIFSI